MKLIHFDSTWDITKSMHVEEMPLNEDLDIPVRGDTVRTSKLEGKVTKVEEGYVYFTTADGRNMRNTIQNCTVIEKLADQECSMCEDEELDEVSTELLAKYKKAAGKDASDADKKGDFKRGDKRFSGIVKATKKQFDNDAKKKTDEGTMSWINRSHPAQDVSYEKVLDRNPETAHSKVVGEERMDELSVDKLRAYKDAARSPESFKNRPLRKLARTIQGVHSANDRIKVKTGDRTGKDVPDRGTYEARLAEFVDSVDEEYRGPHLGDAEKLAKAPKSSMQGKGDVRFSDMVKDAVDTHGVKWAFDYYVNKHGLPPRQFQIFAGLTTKPKTVEPKKADWTDPSTSNRPRPQSWWQKLRGKLPFEE